MTHRGISRKLFTVCLGLLMLVLFHQSARAQEFRGTVQGTVTDSNSAGIPNASVTLLNVATGVKRTATSNVSAHYAFELVEPGTYSVTAIANGFALTTHQGVLLQARGDVTVDAVLNVASAVNTVIVEGNTNTVEFNSSTVAQTLDTKLVEETPNYGRNPFLLALLDPAVVNTRPQNSLPYNTWGSNSLQIAGSQNFSNDIQLDGAPIAAGLKSSYVPNTDAVSEVLIQSNAVDAEFGHSGGGVISSTIKSGTNGWHGDAFWIGRYPWADASQDSYYKTRGTTRQNMYGFVLGNPILKNKLFNFFSWENWRRTDPSVFTATVPTAAEITGDFSGATSIDGKPVIIYDPWSTKTDAKGNVTRTPFPGNIIPANRIDQNASRLLQALNWKPNRTPDDASGVNNWSGSTPVKTNYKNWVDKIDYNMRENLSFRGHWGHYDAPAVPLNSTGSQLYQPTATFTTGTSIGIDMTYVLNPKVVFDLGGSYISMNDNVAPFHDVPNLGWKDLYSAQGFLSQVAIPGIASLTAPPRISIHGNNFGTSFGGPDYFWYSHAEANALWGKALISLQQHQLKVGFDRRVENAKSGLFESSGFGFYPGSTANTYVNPDTAHSGNAYASMLTGALGDPADASWDWSGGTFVHQTIATTPTSNFWSFFVNDDWKVSRNLTITAGLRYEYEEPWTDPKNRASRYLDLKATNAGLAAANPVIDSATMAMITPLYSGPQHLTSGQWKFTDSNNRGMWNTLGNVFLPRLGASYRLGANSVINGAWARWAQPWVQQNYGNTGSFLDVAYPGYTSDQGPAGQIQGVPQVTFSNPYPAEHPIIPAVGQGYGPNLNLGGGAQYYAQNRKKTTSDRFNVQYQRQLPYNFVGKVVYLAAFTRDIGWTYNPNMVNPAYGLNATTGPMLNQQVPNPYYQIETPDKFPGGMLYSKTVNLSQLLRPYPQYGDLAQDWTPGISAHYQSLGFQVQRTYRNGLSLLATYNYHFENDQYFYDGLDQYNQRMSWQASGNSRHGFVETSVYELPIGKNRQYFHDIPTALDYVVGGWQIANVVSINSGSYAGLGGLMQVGNPNASVPHGAFFNPAAFTRVPDYTRQTSHNFYPGVTGPSNFNLDATVTKNFKITERVTGKLNLTGYNALNNFIHRGVETNVGSSRFGYSQLGQGNTGRQVDMGMRITF